MKRILFLVPVFFLLQSAPGQVSSTLDRADQGRQVATAGNRDWDRGGRWWHLRREADHLSDMADHVRSLMRRYGATSYHRDELARIRQDISQINYRVRKQTGNRDRISRDIGKARDGLYRIERQLKFRSRDYYRW